VAHETNQHMVDLAMNRKWQLVTILCVVALITAVVSHSTTSWLRIETAPGGYWVIGPGSGRASVFMAGSSLAGDGIAWPEIANQLNLRIEGWGVAGSSPSEWERFQQLETHTNLAILVVSPYDLNEYFLSDHYPQVVPLLQTLKDLRKTPMDWAFYKRVVSTYPLRYARILFPSAGRSDGVIKGIREKAETSVKSMFPVVAGNNSGPSFTDPVSRVEIKNVQITNWSPSLMLRRIVGMRMACEGKHGYNGLRRLAFLRMLRQAQEQGRVAVVVLPVSPAYAKEFLTPSVKNEFEAMLVEAWQSAPKAFWVRLDQVEELNANQNYYDLVHMNPYGRAIATENLLSQLREFTSLP